MIRIIDGKPVHVPDDETITPEMKTLRVGMNHFLNWLQNFEHSDEGRALRRQYREGVISKTDGYDWYMDPDIKA